MDDQHQLSRRERQIMDAVFARGEASATQVLDCAGEPTHTNGRADDAPQSCRKGMADAAQGGSRVVLQSDALAATGRSVRHPARVIDFL